MIRAIFYLIFGLIAGLVARFLMPGADSMGLLATSLVGIIGSLIGGLLGGVVQRPTPGVVFHPAGFFMSVLGAMLFLFLMRHFG
jgi:uncharacterized membrane protein YeaQ/YmgE (transglycosylase-associated protein family)